MRISWMIGGAQGTGIDTSANIFGKVVSTLGYYIYGNREYHSNIKGRHSYFTLTISDKKVRSIPEKADILVSFDAETVLQHFNEIKGYIIYNEGVKGTKVETVQSMESEAAERISKQLESENLPKTVEGALESAKRRGVKLIPVNYDEIAKKVAEEAKVQLSVVERVKNVIGIAVSTKLLGINEEHLAKVAGSTFKQELYRKLNVMAIKKAYELTESVYSLPKLEGAPERYLLDGNTAVAIGKLYGGLRFQSYYPITPASDESMYIEAHQEVLMEDPKTGDKKKGAVVVVQAEDELAAVNMAVGAALTGIRSSTATSGPGFSLMVEGIGWAGMNEVPVVITYYIRGGPSTGLPTRTSQADLLFSMFAGHGEFPKIVVASGTHDEAFKDAVLTLNLAERYQTPVIHLVEKTLANSYTTVPKQDLGVGQLYADRGKLILSPPEDYARFQFTEDGVSPRAPLGKALMYYTGDEHNEYGFISEDPVNRNIIYEKRMKKLELADKEIPEEERVKVYGNVNSENVVITWGAPTGVFIDILEETKLDFALLQLRMFSPFPSRFVSKFLQGRKKIIAAEGNYLAQAGKIVKMNTGIEATNYILKWNGRPFLRDEVEEALRNVIEKDVKKVMLSGGS
ncbi:2-oxoacid:ferredoxin oxidoreductase subunit alpha [Sulfolobus acidocaldarius]|nr:2-oxoacid:ferredoxin oxidoreductase subunit alpha [Sulfolobus acidocaldarius]AGE70182.1 2-oxoacid-ferredoxin oxidoreductase [Sulfolobus acidocaldarius N8]AGE72457.1 2-oxoacid-ferredoxin oxidoreductase [Sulfolobus acidocaldarius Ron12/I]ALU29408.1 2-oxoacid:ferredoxin oxidoreductase subunit alpha [Sulfolobus acidocaldarius]ALU32136.1 2-oxoacid:ferredoxin oxidoreductase subunit alpha [Sulfolobus acidocaldarius]WCM34202.1 2-oxoacid:acceptor oxidoreductase subunit alpha [Sulfolobus acidocaldari